MSISRQDKIRGSLLGGAIGDALGYPVEFMSYSQIKGAPDKPCGELSRC